MNLVGSIGELRERVDRLPFEAQAVKLGPTRHPGILDGPHLGIFGPSGSRFETDRIANLGRRCQRGWNMGKDYLRATRDGKGDTDSVAECGVHFFGTTVFINPVSISVFELPTRT